jgi:hypothetical protein
MFPKIDSPCPARLTALPIDGQNHCTLCQRQVHNLDHMTADQRLSFLRSCTGKVCVAYTVQRKINHRQARAGVLIAAAALVSGNAFAQAQQNNEASEIDYSDIIIGGVYQPENAQLVEQSALPEMPVLDNDAPELEFVAPPQ